MKMGNGTKVALWCVGIAGAGVGIYFLATKLIVPKITQDNGGNLSKQDKVIGILANSGGQGDYNFLMSLDDKYIQDWYTAVKSKKPTFTSGSGKFDTVTGKAVA